MHIYIYYVRMCVCVCVRVCVCVCVCVWDGSSSTALQSPTAKPGRSLVRREHPSALSHITLMHRRYI